jgi:hypothetical protein
MMTAINGKKIVLCVIAVFMALVFALSANAASDWPNYLGPTNDFQPELKEFTATSAEEVWRVQLKTAMSSVTIADGLLYTMGNDGTKRMKTLQEIMSIALTQKQVKRYGNLIIHVSLIRVCILVARVQPRPFMRVKSIP